MTRANRGQVRIVEAFLAVLIVFSGFAVSANMTDSRGTPARENLASVGLQSLLKLDQDGSLSKSIGDRNWTALRESLNLILPAGVSFNVTVYDDQMLQINSEPIANGGFASQEKIVVEYVSASSDAVFQVYVIRLSLAVATS